MSRPSKGRGLKILLCIIAVLAVFIAVVNIIPPRKVTDSNPFLKEKGAKPMIAAHRGGGISNPENTLMRGASTSGAAKFIISQLLRVNAFNKADFTCLQIPMGYDIKGVHLDLTRKTIIDRAHRRNIAVQFWTINEEEDMRKLIELDVDAIMTDDPQLLKRVLEEY